MLAVSLVILSICHVHDTLYCVGTPYFLGRGRAVAEGISKLASYSDHCYLTSITSQVHELHVQY